VIDCNEPISVDDAIEAVCDALETIKYRAGPHSVIENEYVPESNLVVVTMARIRKFERGESHRFKITVEPYEAESSEKDIDQVS
jgi:hypothetical protein